MTYVNARVLTLLRITGMTHRVSFVLLLCIGLTATGCISNYGLSDVEEVIEIGTTTKSEVLSLRPSPNWENPENHSLYYWGLGDPGSHVILFPVLLYLSHDADSDDWWLEIGFTDAGIVSSVKTLWGSDARIAIEAVKYPEIRRKAYDNDVDSALDLARLYHELDPLIRIANRSNSVDSSELFIRSTLPLYDIPEATRWLCSASNEHVGKAQLKLGFWHLPDIWEAMEADEQAALRSAGLQANARVAYMWYTLAGQNGIADATSFRGAASAQMNHEEISQAEQLVRNWKPGQCPSPLL